jgi:hypothetical protein
MTAQDYRQRVAEVAATLNALGAANQVRNWLEEGRDRPRMGKALSLALLLSDPRAVEFLL